MRDCSGCTVTVAWFVWFHSTRLCCLTVFGSQQFRPRDCHDCLFYIFAATDPAIETSSRLKFGPWNGAYPHAIEQFTKVFVWCCLFVFFCFCFLLFLVVVAVLVLFSSERVVCRLGLSKQRTNGTKFTISTPVCAHEIYSLLLFVAILLNCFFASFFFCLHCVFCSVLLF